MHPGNGVDAESVRIASAYARRRHTVPDARYSFFDRANLFIIQERQRHLLALLRRHHVVRLDRTKILEVGCGTGYWLREFVQWGARPENVFGIDLLHDRIIEARKLCPNAVRIDKGQAAELAFPDRTFDLVFQSTVFTSILDSAVKRQVASEMLRVVKRDGLIVWYDFHTDNPRNPDVRGVKKREIYRLFPGCRIDLRRITVAPPLLRLLAPYSWLACYVLGQCSWPCTHYIGAIRLAEQDTSASTPPSVS